MPTIIKFEDIEDWQTARELTHQIYKLTKQGQFAKDFRLCDQMRRASVSIMSNIAKRFESRTQILFNEYLGRVKASAGELRSQIYIANDCGYITKSELTQVFDLCDKCSRHISRLMQYLIQRPNFIREEGIEYNV